MDRLTKFSKGSVREFFSLSFPIFIALLSRCAMSFCDRCFLSRYSIEAFEGVALGGYLAFFIQAPCMQLVSTNQTFTSQSIGEKSLSQIAPYTWQMIWASFLTMLVIIPVGLIVNHYYFSDTVPEQFASQYFLILLFGNFLFALGSAFIGFQSGIGETKVVTRAALIANIMNFFLNYFLIFGVKNWFGPLGVIGAAWGTVLSQGLYCLILFFSFARHKKGEVFQVQKWRFSLPLFTQIVRVGIPRAACCAADLFYWIIAVKLISGLGGDFLLVLSYGSTLWLPSRAVASALNKGAISLFSFFLGENNPSNLWKSFRSSLILLSLASLILGIPMVVFSEPLIKMILSADLAPSSLQVLKWSSLWFWVYFFLFGLCNISFGFVISLKKTPFMMKLALFIGGISIILPYYLAFHVFHCAADKVWMVNWLYCIFLSLILLYKAFVEVTKRKAFPLKNQDSVQQELT